MLASFSGYKDVDKVRNFVESFQRYRSREDHLMIMTTEDEDNPVRQWLSQFYDIEVLQVPHYSGHPYYDRFKWFQEATVAWDSEELVMACDIRDVVFQDNPFKAVKDRLKYDMIFVSENIDFREDWNGTMLKRAFPEWFDTMRMKPVYNCGVMMGKSKAFSDTCKEIFLMCQRAPEWDVMINGESCWLVHDQAAYSILVNESKLKYKGTVTSNMQSLVFTAAPAGHDIKKAYVVGGKFCNNLGLPYAIVHQYDRLKEVVSYEEHQFMLGEDKLLSGEINFTFDKDARYTH